MSFARAKRFSYSDDHTKDSSEHKDCRRCSLRKSRRPKKDDTCLDSTRTLNTSNSTLPTRKSKRQNQRSVSDNNIFGLVHAGPSGFIDDDFTSYTSYSNEELERQHYFEFKNLSKDIEKLCSLDSLENENSNRGGRKSREIDVKNNVEEDDFSKSMSFIESLVNQKVEEELTKHTLSKWRRKIYHHAELMAATIIDDFTSILSFKKKSK